MKNAAEVAPQFRLRCAPPSFVHLVFFLSGLAALVYEVSWNRQIGLAIGNTAHAAALVLASYFFGLAMGQFAGGWLARRMHPLLGYGLAEVAAAAWACVIPTLLDWVGSSEQSSELPILRGSTFGRASCCFFILLPATVSLGATLPLIVEYLSATRASKRHVTLAYGLNTAGGLLGIIAALAILLISVGVRGSGYLAAALSLLCGVAAIVVSLARRELSQTETQTAAGASENFASLIPWATASALSGFGTLGLEVLFMRMFALVFHNSSYTFGAVIAAFLLALSLGALIASFCATRFSSRGLVTLAFALGGLLLAVSVVVFPRATGLSYFKWGDSFEQYLAGSFGLVALFVLPPVMFLGMAFPATLQSAVDRGSVGRLCAVNTFAAAAGALAAGFVFPPVLGLWDSFALFAGLFVLAGIVLLARRHRFTAAAFAIAGVGIAYVGVGRIQLARDESKNMELVWRWESDYGWIDVIRNELNGSLAIQQNLHYRHGSSRNSVRQYREGRLPLLLHAKPTDVAFLGLGTGLTATPAIVDRDVKSAVIVELIPEVVEASRYLAETNLAVVDDKKVQTVIDDARQYLVRTGRQFDVIVADLFVPWESRTGYLYTTEFYRVVRQRLKAGGIFCQWLALYQVGPEDFESIANTFASEFANTTIWWSELDARYPIVALIGSDSPLEIDGNTLGARMAAQAELPGQKDSTLGTPADLPSLYLGDWPRDPAPRLNTDEHPWLEFTAPISHRSRRTLHGQRLEQFFDQAFATLPASGARFGAGFNTPAIDADRRRTSQRFALFGDVKPAANP